MLLRLCLCSLVVVSTLLAQDGGRGRGSAAGGPQSGPPPPPPPTDCAVSGTVVNAMTGEPIPRATVSLGGPDASGSATDATGHWSISSTSCTSNRPVTASRVGFINSLMNQANPARPVTVNLVSGSPVSGVKISLMPESSITGKVLDPDGDPIESARIQALKVMVQVGQRMLVNVGASATDSQGNFRIGGLQPGRYVICAGSPQLTYPVGGGPAMAYRDDCYPGPAASGISIAMPVEAGREVRTAFTLNPMPAMHVRGHVSGLPATALRSNVQLIIRPGNGAFQGRNLNTQVREDGSFDIATVSPGSYIAMLNWQTNPPGPQPVTVQAPIEVGNSDVDSVSLTFQPGGSLSGTVHYQFLNTTTPANPPVTVNLRPASNNGFVGPIPQAQWDSDHLNFSFANVPPGSELRLNVNVNSHEAYVRSATLRGQDVINQPFTVEGTAGPIDIVVSDDTGSIDVTVNDNDGHPVADASVILLSTSGLRRTLSSGDDGQAIQKNLPVGEYGAWAFENLATVPYAEEEWMNQNAGSGEKVSITSGGAATLTLKQLPAPKE